MENTELGYNTNYKMVPTNSLHGDVVGTSSSPHQGIIEDNMVENHQINEENMLDERMRKRLVSNRLSARRSRSKKSRTQYNLENKVETSKYQLSELESLQASEQIQDHLLDMEEEVLYREIGALYRDELLMNVREEKLHCEGERMKQLRSTQQKHMLDQNSSMLEPITISSSSLGSYDPYLCSDVVVYKTTKTGPAVVEVEGNGIGTSYMPLDPSQMWVPPVQNMQEMNLMTMPINNNMGSMDQSNAVWGGTAPNLPNFNE